MNAVDLVLLAAAVVFAITGWRQGLVRGVLSMGGFVAGAVLAVAFVPDLLERWDVGPVERGVVAVLALIAAAIAGQVVGAVLGRWLHRHLTWHPAQVVDAAAGTVFSLLALALVVWVVASAVSLLPDRGVAAQVRSSLLLSHVDAVVPDQARALADGLREALGSSDFPRVFAGITEPPVLPVDPPDPAVLDDPAVRRAAGSLVRVEGAAPACDEAVSGTGFVYTDHRVMTNAHVVAGVANPRVRVLGTGVAYDARVVVFDPQTDVAVLDVPELTARTLSFARGTPATGDPAVVAGFPGGGRLSVVPARVRGQISARGRDIHGSGLVVRDVYALRGSVRPGNSGGPLLDPAGEVIGVVFAASVDDPDTGYALTNAQVAPAAAAGRSATEAVGTGTCIPR